MAQLAKQEACQLYIEQEIEGGLEREETPYQIAKRLIGEMQKLFEVSVKRDTIRKRAQRQKKKLGTNVPKKSNNNTNNVLTL